MLEKIKKPEDIKKLSFHELGLLATDVRQRIIEVTCINGGHVAPSLGAVDFIIALLKVFNPLNDRIVFDVGHQAYAYKILTERNDRFDTLRTYGGISGFNNIFESNYDAFSVGHSSTSISAALGIKIAMDSLEEKGTSIAIIGDGALTGGMAFEALNHAGHLQKNMIVILNDNEMSISPNVGALQHYLTNVLVSKSYNTLKKQVWDLSQSLPGKVRKTFIYGAQKLEESLMNIIVPNIFFEDLGFKYIGPVNGHDIPRLCRIFNKIKTNIEGPVLIHLVTQKGKGLSFAETNAAKFHGIGPYNKKNGHTTPKKNLSWSEVFGNKLVEMAKTDKKIVAITSAMTDGTGLTKFNDTYPDRLFDVGIAEQHAITLSAGLASKGLKPYIAIYSTFLQRALDQVIHDVALQKHPVVICIDRAGLVGEDGATHQGVFDLSFLQFVPNLCIIAPTSASELELCLEWSKDFNDLPVAIRYPRGTAQVFEHTHSSIKFSKAEIWNKGSNIAIIGVGHSFSTAFDLYNRIIENYEGINPYLINPRFIKPFDKQLFDEIKDECSHFIIIEENAQIGGFASRLGIEYASDDIKIHSFAIPDEFIEHGKTELLRNLIGLSTEKIYNKISPILDKFI
ncbi:MAG: 1-deoxy-D-xylulose-5-phosphate synthase [Candidatus Cloacimonetes bacterium]|nr:1-deoxy-D-xylulose-5-phosphate synthase [Candidatus Cloacimonadota bacterium]